MSILRTARSRRGLATLATGIVLALGAGGAALACGEEPEPCPAKQIQKVWDGGTSYHPSCENLADWFDHLFYPGYQLNTSQQGTYQENVVVVQLRLRDLGYGPIAVDGHFGPQTAAAVKRFQDDADLAVVGYVGPKTWHKLFGAASWN